MNEAAKFIRDEVPQMKFTLIRTDDLKLYMVDDLKDHEMNVS